MRTFLASLAFVAACNGTTGDQLITFSAYASGVSGASDFTLNGYDVHLTTARMHIGAVYINESPIGTQAETPVCINPGIYAAQVAGPIDVDLLDTTPQPFSVQGNGTADVGQSWELWLTDDDGNPDSIDSLNFDHTVDLQGIATRQADGARFPFATIVTINTGNRGIQTTDPAQPGLNPICKQRIVLVGGIDLQLHPGASLQVTVDPRVWFALETQLDFSTLPLTTDIACSSAPPYGDETVPIDPLTDYGPAICQATLGNGSCPTGTQLDPLTCTTTALPCELPTRCIPNSNTAPGDVGTVAFELFKGIASGGAAYSVSYGP